MSASLESLEALLRVAAQNLDLSASMIRDLGLSPDKNIRKVGEALASIFEIQHEIYEIRPELKPDYLKRKKE